MHAAKERHYESESSRTLYSLAEVATITGKSVNNVLCLGGDGSLPLYVRVSENLQVYRTNPALLGSTDGTYAGLLQRMHVRQFASGIRPRLLSEAAFLLVDPQICKLLAAHGDAYQPFFKEAYRISSELDLVVIDQPRTGFKEGIVDIGSEFIACYVRGEEPFIMGVPTEFKPVGIPLAIGALRVRHRDLVKIGLAREAEVSQFDNGFREEPHMSKMLLELNEAARRFWDRSREGWSSPLNSEVEKWLRSGDRAWGVKAAQAAATILRDSYEDWDQEEYQQNCAKISEEKRDKPLSFAPAGLNKFDAVVHIAQRWKNADLQQGQRTEKLETYPDKRQAILLLEEKYGFAPYLAKAAWGIVSPKGVVKKGRPRSTD